MKDFLKRLLKRKKCKQCGERLIMFDRTDYCSLACVYISIFKDFVNLPTSSEKGEDKDGTH